MSTSQTTVINKDEINIKFVNADGKVMNVLVNKKESVEVALQEYANHIGISIDYFEFVYKDNHIRKETPSVLGMRMNDLVLVNTTGILLKFVNEDDHFLKEKTYVVSICQSLENVMKKYVDDNGIIIDNIRFMFKGKRICGNQSPKNLRLKENDRIDVMPELESVNVKVIAPNGFNMDFRIKFTEPLGEFMDDYEIMVGMDQTFLFGYRTIRNEDTPSGLRMGENNVIRVDQANDYSPYSPASPPYSPASPSYSP